MSPNRLIFRFFQWLYWGEVGIFKGLIEILEERIRRPGSETGMLFKSAGAIYFFDPAPVFRSFLGKAPYVVIALLVSIPAWAVITFPLISAISSVEAAQDALSSGCLILVGLLGVAAVILWIVTPGGPSTVAVIFQDQSVFVHSQRWGAVPNLPQFRVVSDIDRPFSFANIFGEQALIEISVDGGKSWNTTCRLPYLSYRISRLIEEDSNWPKVFEEFVRLVCAHQASMNADPEPQLA
ncbi:hypothetical protein ABIB99_000624 [Bradyrhizobium sp. LA6.1]|uniref:hypothetical protein n=1 Tax=Bradyrhizobium sp. LA6.1 TaxID=3156378 RepID=UPI003390C745